MTWATWLGVAVMLVLITYVALRAVGSSGWDKATQVLEAQLEASQEGLRARHYESTQLAGLPLPVQRYFRLVLKEGQPMIAGVSVDHVGTFNMGEAVDAWKPFTSRQRVATRRPGFVWDGRVDMAPGFAVCVHDAYISGVGILHAALLGVFTVADLRGGGDIAQGELMRFFAEAAWYPTALLPSEGVDWEGIDEHSARGTLVDSDVRVTLLFRFNDDGLIESVHAESRGRTVGETVVSTPWEGRWSRYEERDGMQLPISGEVAWLTREGRRPYWRGTIGSIRYEFTSWGRRPKRRLSPVGATNVD